MILASVGLLVVLLIALAVVSWLFSSLVLVPDHSALPSDATVIGVSNGRVALSRSEVSLRPGTFGLDWHAGHAIVGPIVAGGSSSVTRELRDVRGHLTPWVKVAFDSSVYEGNPKLTVGLPFSNIPIPDELGPMPAWLIPARTNTNTSTWAIVVHGINGNRENNLRIVPTLHRAGLPTLLINYRGDVGAPAAPTASTTWASPSGRTCKPPRVTHSRTALSASS
jgi:uncharacterized protein